MKWHRTEKFNKKMLMQTSHKYNKKICKPSTKIRIPQASSYLPVSRNLPKHQIRLVLAKNANLTTLVTKRKSTLLTYRYLGVTLRTPILLRRQPFFRTYIQLVTTFFTCSNMCTFPQYRQHTFVVANVPAIFTLIPSLYHAPKIK